MGGYRDSPEQRIFESIEQFDDCWIANLGASNSTGYSLVGYGPMLNRKKSCSHRIIYEWLFGKISDGLVLDHICRAPNCVNPFHLEEVTQRENTVRGVGPSANNSKKTHCIRGHEFSTENTRCYTFNGTIHRQCRMCEKNRLANAYRRKLCQASHGSAQS